MVNSLLDPSESVVTNVGSRCELGSARACMLALLTNPDLVNIVACLALIVFYNFKGFSNL